MRRIFITFLALSALGLAASAWAGPEAPPDLRLSAPESIKASKTPVEFPHGRHVEANLECTTCHHTWDGKAEIKACGTAGCHDQPGKKDPGAYYNAYHAKDTDRSCLGCHKIVKKRDGKPVPVSCKQCHPK